MQALSVLPVPHAFLISHEFAPLSAKSDQDFTFKLRSDHDVEKFEEEEEQEFSFACSNPQGSLVTANEIFHNGQIRPMYPVFDQSHIFAAAHSSAPSALQPPLKKLFIEQQGAPEGTLRELSWKTTALEVEVENSKEMCKKSNSTGFSKLWRFRQDLKLRSNSDGKDAFVLLNAPPPANSKTKVKNFRQNKGKRKTALSSAHEKLYVMNRKRKESDKRRSFLPYRVGFFANMNGLSRNLHPF